MNDYTEFEGVEATEEQRQWAKLRELVEAEKWVDALALAKAIQAKERAEQNGQSDQNNRIVELIDTEKIDLEGLIGALNIEVEYHRPAPTWQEFRRNAPKEIEYFVEGLIMKNAKCYLAAESKFGKSFLTMYLAFCAASGKPFFGREVKQCPVMIIDKENSLSLNWWRSDAIGRGLGLSSTDIDGLPIMPLFQDDTSLTEDASIERLKRYISDFKPGLIIVDTLIRCTRGLEENKSDDMNEVAEVISELKRDTGQDFTFFFLHHTNKDKDATGQAKVRGSGDITAMVDHGFALDKVIEANGSEKFGLTEPSPRNGQGSEITYRLVVNKITKGDMVNFIEITRETGQQENDNAEVTKNAKKKLTKKDLLG